MLQIPYEKLAELIVEKSDVSQDELTQLVAQKLEEFSGLISEEGALHVVAHDLGVSLADQINQPLQITDIKAGQRGVTLKAKIIKKYQISTFTKDGNEGTVGSVLVGDETGVMRITFWHAQTDIIAKIEEGRVYTFTSLSAKENQGRVELTYGQSSEYTQEDEDLQVSQKPVAQSIAPIAIKDAKESQVASFVGVIVQVLKPTIYIVDKQTQKRVRIQLSEFSESEHEYAVVSNILLDDGSEIIRCACFRNVCESLFETSIQTLVEEKDNESFFESQKVSLLGKMVQVTGRITKNELYDRLECIASHIDLSPDPATLLK